MVDGDAPVKSSVDPLIGKVLNGRFTILEPLGSGGMGRVYKALQAPLDRLVALKVLNPSYGAGKDPGFAKRFFLEASLTAKLHHPNTITVHDYGRTDDGIYYIAMEYVEGQTLAQLLQREGALPWQRALHIAQQICRSLREAHRLGIIHRDLKPANVMILNEETEHDLVKVLDFGLVKPFLPDGRPSPEETELTQAGVLLGSPMYMAPEQARHESDPRSDVYSLGVVLYQMLAGRPPFEGKESIDVIVKHIRENAPNVKVFRPEIPDDVAALTMRCLEKDPAHRFQSMDELLEAIRQAASAAGLSGVFSSPRTLSFTSVPRVTTPSDPGVTRLARTPPGQPISEVLDISVSTRRLPPPKWIAAGVFALALATGAALAVVLVARRPSPPAPPPTVRVEMPPKPPPEPVKPPPEPPRPVPVRFKVTSTPEGARVVMDGKVLGQTPLTLELPPNGTGVAAAALTFSLDGYETLTLNASGKGPEVVVHPKLVKKKTRPTRPTKPKEKDKDDLPPGYKEDPYD